MEEAGYLRLSLETDSDGTGELFAEVSSSGFSGHGSAWFNLQELAVFAKQLGTIPLPADNDLCLEGGYGNQEKPGALDQVHLSIRIYPIGTKGQIGARVQVADRVERLDRPESQNSAMVELKTSYAALERFAQDLDRLSRSSTSEAVLNGEALS
jgi:hypothetical protein